MKQIRMTDEQYDAFRIMVKGTRLSSLIKENKKKNAIPKSLSIKIDTNKILSDSIANENNELELARKSMRVKIKYAKLYYPIIWDWIRDMNGIFANNRDKHSFRVPYPIKVRNFEFTKESEDYYLNRAKGEILLAVEHYINFNNDCEDIHFSIGIFTDSKEPYISYRLGNRDQKSKILNLTDELTPSRLKSDLEEFSKYLIKKYVL